MRRVFFAFLIVAGVAAAAARVSAQGYVQHNVVSSIPGLADQTDDRLINAWGIYVKRNGTVVVNATDADLSLAYKRDGAALPLAVEVPGGPTGIAYNSTSDFVISANGKSGRSQFLFVTEAGTILGWNPNVDATHAVVAVNAFGGAIYKGIALATTDSGESYLYAADFHNSRVNIYDGDFKFVKSFTDPALANNSFGPFNVANIGGYIYVAFAMQNADKDEEIAGAGFGYVDVFDKQGNFLRRFASEGALNAPWAIVRAPSSFGEFAGAILVGNFGDGWINAFNNSTGAPLGHLTTSGGQAVAIDGLWGLTFHNGTLWFAAGPNLEEDGLVGTLKPATP